MLFKMISRGLIVAVMAGGLCLWQGSQAFANRIGNESFESPIGSGVGGNWDATNGAVRTTPGDGNYPALFSNPPDGNYALRIPGNSFTFQTHDNVKPGDFVVFSAYAESSVAPGGGNGGDMKIEFKKVNPDGGDELISAVRLRDSAGLITTANAPNNGGFVQFQVSGVAPPGTGRVVFVLTQEGGAGNLLYDDLNGEVNPAKFLVSASKNTVKRGEPVTIFLRYSNDAGVTLNNVELQSTLPLGFDLLPDSVRLNGAPVQYREGSIIIPVGSIDGGATFTTSFQVLATSIVQLGKLYQIEVVFSNGTAISEKGFVQLSIVGDPLFDQGTLIGKVFNDLNQNGVQDECEPGVPGVRLVTEEGIVVRTDDKGRYHIPGLSPGRHLVKIDGHSLPEGTRFITEETYLIKTTPGILNKANFAVLLPPSKIPENFQKDLQVTVTQGMDAAKPNLGVVMEPSLLKAGIGVFEKDPVFRFQLNYGEFVKEWYLEIRDEAGKEVWTGLGVGDPPPEVVWTGKTEEGLFVKPGIYSYRFKVRDRSAREDWTPLGFFRVISKVNAGNQENLEVEIPSIGEFNIFKDGKQSIPLVAKPTLEIRGKTVPGNRVTINNRSVPVSSEGIFQTQVYTSPGEKEIVVTSTHPEGESLTYRENVKVKDSLFFMVGLAEQEMGVKWSTGNLETVGRADEFKDSFYQDGRLSYYLIGKIRGKFLVKSHYDTGDKRSALFTNLDPDDYYPVYGDQSTRDYEAQDSLQRFYLVIEMDRSFIKWGSFQTAFTDTELARYHRTLSGLKFHHETLSATAYGDPKQGLTGYWNQSKQIADHNEFAATGGSLYYLRNRRVIEGSEKLRVEFRDKLQDMPVGGYDLKEGKDYEIDYEEGRVMLSRPLSSVAASDTLISADILDGNRVYLIVDYEFDAPQTVFESGNRGLRGYTHLGDHVKVGGTFVEEKRQNYDYDLRGVDATFKFGRNTRVFAEYAESKHEQVKHALSYNGGLSFYEQSPMKGQDEREEAWVIKAESKPLKNTEVAAYIQSVEPGFSNDRIQSQEGFRKYGLTARYKFTDHFYTRYRYDTKRLVSQLRPAEQSVMAPYENVETHTAQLVYEDGKYLGQLEYLRQTSDLPGTNLVPTFLSEAPFENGIAGKFGYALNERLMPYVKVQTTVEGKPNHQFGGGLRYRVVNDVYAYIEQMFGNIGDSTYFGFERYHAEGARSYFNMRMFDRGVGHKTLASAIGSSFSLTPKSRFYSERQYSSYESVDGFSDILGIDGRVNNQWDYDVKFERRHLDNSRFRLFDTMAEYSLAGSNSSNVISGALGYADHDRFRARSALEVRIDDDHPELWQWYSRSSIDYRITEDLSFLGKYDFAKSRFRDPAGNPAAFTEMNFGVAYRPVWCDRLNWLTRYTYLRDEANDLQFSTGLFQGLETDQRSHIFAVDLAYELHKYLQVVEKVAYRKGIYSTAVTDDAVINSLLWINRLNFHVTRKWDVALEYRTLWQTEAADSLRQGALVEIDREFYDYVRLGLGYNFTDFSDDLRKLNDLDSQGPFVRMTGKF